MSHMTLDSVTAHCGHAFAGSPIYGEHVTLGFTDAWNKDDVDYTPYSNIISAVWPSVRNSKVTWAILESEGPNVTFHFLAPDRQSLVDPCSSPSRIACGQVTSE